MVHLRHGSRLNGDTRGASAVEFALILPVFVLMLMGLMQFSFILYTYNTAESASRDVARRVAVNNLSTTSASAAAKERLPTWVRDSSTVTVTQSTPSNIYTNQITVSISFPASAASPTNFVSAAVANKTLQVATTMKQEPSL